MSAVRALVPAGDAPAGPALPALIAGADEVADPEDSVLRLMLSDLAVRRHEPSGAHEPSVRKRRQKRAEGDSKK
jgi:hypothetical protein